MRFSSSASSTRIMRLSRASVGSVAVSTKRSICRPAGQPPAGLGQPLAEPGQPVAPTDGAGSFGRGEAVVDHPELHHAGP